MVKIHLKLDHSRYDIVVGSRILPKIGKMLKRLNLGKDAVIITNSAIIRFHGRALLSSLKRSGFSVKVMEVPEGEKSKSASMAFKLIEKIAAYAVKRKVFIIAMGGGVVGDLAGYVAAAYKRGIPYVQVPTTVLAQIDSAIGGKVGVDLPVGKNLIGAFYQPRLVLSDVATLSTLNKRQIRNGLAEAVKYGVIRDKKLFEYIEKNYSKLLILKPEALTKVVLRCSKIKADIVKQDEKETKGIRTILNFGHTVGHAIEAAGGYHALHHGEAVAIGMRIAGDISQRMGYFSQANLSRLETVLTNIGLPSMIKKIRLDDILGTMQHDKKFVGSTNRFVLAVNLGRVRVVEGVPADIIKKAIRARMGR